MDLNVEIPAKMANRSDDIIYGDRLPALWYAAIKYSEAGVIEWLKVHVLYMYSKCGLHVDNREVMATETARELYATCKFWRINTVLYLFYAAVSGRFGTMKVQFNLSQFMEIVQKIDAERRKKVAELYEKAEAEAKQKAMAIQEIKAKKAMDTFKNAAIEHCGKEYYKMTETERRNLRMWVYETGYEGFLQDKEAENA